MLVEIQPTTTTGRRADSGIAARVRPHRFKAEYLKRVKRGSKAGEPLRIEG